MQIEANRPLSRGMVKQSNTVDLQESVAVFEKRMSKIISFADMGLNAEEIKIGLAIEVREDVSYNEINSILTTAITKGRLPKEGYSGENDVSLTEEERVNKVLKRVVARENPQVESMGNIDKPLGIVKKLLGRGAALPDAMQIAQLEHTPTKDPIVRFAQELAADDEIISNDRSDFEQLNLICVQNKIRFPHLAYYIIFEALIKARKGIKASPQDLTLLNKYNEKRALFFNEENENAEESDGESELTGVPKLSDLEERIIELDDGMVIRTDMAGLFRSGKNGGRYREPAEFDENGFVIFDNADLFVQRAKSRDRIVESWQDSSSTKAQKSVALWEKSNPLDI
jgi:hypothetical protein